jgi:hypothetical protein
MKQLYDKFKVGDPLGRIPSEWLNTVALWLNGMNIVGGKILWNTKGITICPGTGAAGSDWAWNVKLGEGSSVNITPGDVELGPDLIIPWESITGATTVLSGVEWIWVNIDVSDGSESAEMLSGSSVTSLTTEEKKHICQKRIARILTADEITVIKRYQCGNIFIPRL